MTIFVKFIDDRHDLRKNILKQTDITSGRILLMTIIIKDAERHVLSAHLSQEHTKIGIVISLELWKTIYKTQKLIGMPYLTIYVKCLKSYRMMNTTLKMKSYNFLQC